MKNPKTQQNFIDLKDLLFNAPLYAKWFKDSSDSENYFYSTRSCVENNKNKYYCAQKESEDECVKQRSEKMEICDHPNYGWTNASFEEDSSEEEFSILEC
uniref:Uncharacterized protein n=1 Tax=Meloidogyne enterolobii TaxID=390850 RepID=A0A6V7V8A3_MELEN|nr:unnamed protein product [Meloidogyne enterolobii]